MTAGSVSARRHGAVSWLAIAGHAVAILSLAYWLVLTAFWPYRAEIPASQIDRDAGYAVIVPMDRLQPLPPPLAELRQDSPSKPQASHLVLLEDGRPPGPAHAAPEAVRRLGGGRYAHRGGEIVFSSGDGTDPAHNGRRYTVAAPLAAEPPLQRLALLSALFISYRLARRRLLATGRATTGTVAELWMLIRRAVQPARRWALLAGRGAAALVIAYWLAAEFFPWSYRMTVWPGQIAADEGLAVSAPILPRWPLVAVRGDARDGRERSALALTEDGHALGPPHASDTAIREQGAGRYSHRERMLVFSSSDGSDPRTNGRAYAVRAPIAPTPLLRASALAGLLILLPLVVAAMQGGLAFGRRRLPAMPMLRHLDAGLARARSSGEAACAWVLTVLIPGGFGLISRPLSRRVERLLLPLASIAVIALAWRAMHADWSSGHTAFGALAGILPLSDANGYNTCGNDVLDLGRFAAAYAEWCTRRPIYASVLASLMALGGRHLHIALLWQAAVVSLAIIMLAREATRIGGVIGGALVATLLFIFAARYGYDATMSENAGLAFGALALALLLRGAESGGAVATYAGLGLLSLALNARAGCFFVLPLAVLWVGWTARLRQAGMILPMLWACLAIAMAFGLDLLLIALNGVSLGHANSNFAYTLYGLAIGGKGWQQIIVDHPELWSLASEKARNHAIYAYAFAAMREHPTLIIDALWSNLATTWHNGIGLYGGYFSNLKNQLWWLWAVGWAAIAMRFRDPRHSLVGFLSIGDLLSGPIIVQDGAERVFAATIAVDAMQACLGLAFLCGLVARLGSIAAPPPLPGEMRHVPRAALALGIFLVAASLAGYTPLRHAVALPRIAAAPCPDDERTVLTQLGRASVALTITGQGTAQIYPPSVPLSDLLRSMRSNEAIIHTLSQPTPYSLLLAYQQGKGASDAGVIYPMRWFGDAAQFFGKPVRICFTTKNPYRDDLWGESYLVRSLEVLPSDPAAGGR